MSKSCPPRQKPSTEKKGGPEGPWEIWKEIGNWCWDPGKRSWDEAGRTQNKRGARTRPNSFFSLAPVPVRAVCLSPPNIPSKPGTHDVNTRPRSSSLYHTYTPSPARRSLASHHRRNSRQPRRTCPWTRLLFLHLRRRWPFFRVIENHAPLHSERRILQSSRSQTCQELTTSSTR